MKDNKKDALDYHEFPQPGKIAVVPTKKHASQYDLSLAYSPGVAEPCLAIEANKNDAYRYTNKRLKIQYLLFASPICKKLIINH